MVPASLGKTASETDPLVFNLPIVLLHVVEPDREVQLGRDQPSDGRRQVEFRKSRIVLRGNELRLGLQQRLVLDQNVQHGAGADQRLLLGPFERDLSRSHSRRARATSPISTSADTSQNEQIVNVPSSPARPSSVSSVM